MKNKKNVIIQTETVNITKEGKNKKKRQKPYPEPKPQRKRKETSRARDLQMLQPTIGTQSGLAGLLPRPEYQKCTEFTDQACQFIQLYADPLGEHCSSTDAARVPDNALEATAPAFVRRLDTIKFPFQSGGSIALEGKTYSSWYYAPPLFRALCFIILKEVDGELTVEEVDEFCVSFANISTRELALFPNFVEIQPGYFWTAVDTIALREILPPNELGVSSLIQKYRFTSSGLEIFFNTPDLLDQGTYAAMRYPTDVSVKTFVEETEIANARPVYIQYSIQYLTPSPAAFVGISGALTPELASFQGFVRSPADPQFPSPTFTAEYRLRNAAGTFELKVNDEYEYIIDSFVFVQIHNITEDTFITIATLNPNSIPNTNFSGSIRLYETGVGLPDRVDEYDFTVISLPPLSQADEYQQNPKVAATLLKETGGVYCPAAIYQPIFEVTSASDYRKILFTTSTVDVKKLINPNAGWFDTCDKNFSTQVINMQSIPYACKPMMKLGRGLELVPSANSVVGLFVQGPPSEQPESIEICRAFSASNPQGFPTNYNGMGVLFAKVLAVTQRIPDMLRSGHNLYREVKAVLDEEAISEATAHPEAEVLRGFKNLMSRF